MHYLPLASLAVGGGQLLLQVLRGSLKNPLGILCQAGLAPCCRPSPLRPYWQISCVSL
jgi:hypothetical protein